MKKIAILSSGGSETPGRLIKMFNQGSRLHVELIVTDRENSGFEELLSDSGVEIVFLPREVWHGDGDELLGLLSSHGIDIVALDKLKGIVPVAVEKEYSDRMIELKDSEEAPRQLVAMLSNNLSKGDSLERNADEPIVSSSSQRVRPVPPPVPKSVDEEWAETLQVRFDPAQVKATPVPPPVPVEERQEQKGKERPYFLRYESTQPQPPAAPMPSTYLIWAVLATVFCCLIPGVVAIVFASQVSTRYAVGDMDGARRASRRAQIWIIISIVLGVVSAGLYLPIMLL